MGCSGEYDIEKKMRDLRDPSPAHVAARIEEFFILSGVRMSAENPRSFFWPGASAPESNGAQFIFFPPEADPPLAGCQRQPAEKPAGTGGV